MPKPTKFRRHRALRAEKLKRIVVDTPQTALAIGIRGKCMRLVAPLGKFSLAELKARGFKILLARKAQGALMGESGRLLADVGLNVLSQGRAG